jgi:thiamine-phosphate pyrophosphorylase
MSSDFIKNWGIYPVITSEFCAGRSSLAVLNAVIEGGAKIVQLREKSCSRRELYSLALQFRKITSAQGVALIINDCVDIALAVGAEGVHLGQDDLPLAAARKIAQHLWIGVSTHSDDEIKAAEKSGATYINIGPIFATATKSLSMAPLGLEYLKSVNPKLPFTVMGGIHGNNIKSVLECGAQTIAMVTEISMASDIAAKVRSLQKLCLKTHGFKE